MATLGNDNRVRSTFSYSIVMIYVCHHQIKFLLKLLMDCQDDREVTIGKSNLPTLYQALRYGILKKGNRKLTEQRRILSDLDIENLLNWPKRSVCCNLALCLANGIRYPMARLSQHDTYLPQFPIQLSL